MLRVSSPLLQKATSSLHHAIGIAYAAGLLEPAPRILNCEPSEADVFSPASVADPMGVSPHSVVGDCDGSHARIRNRLHFASHCVEGPNVGLPSVVVSCAHIEGVVQGVMCGYAGADLVLQLVLDVEESGERLPLAVRWRPGCSESMQQLKDEMCVSEMKRKFKGKRVLASGRMKMEERHDTSSRALHKVPILLLPSTPSLDGSSLIILAE